MDEQKVIYVVIPFHDEYGYRPSDSYAFDSEGSAKAYAECCYSAEENGWIYEVVMVDEWISARNAPILV